MPEPHNDCDLCNRVKAEHTTNKYRKGLKWVKGFLKNTLTNLQEIDAQDIETTLLVGINHGIKLRDQVRKMDAGEVFATAVALEAANQSIITLHELLKLRYNELHPEGEPSTRVDVEPGWGGYL